MKKILLLVLMLWMFSAKAQTSVYHPFPDSNAVWNISFQPGPCAGPWYEEDYSYIFSGDTLIHGTTTYHKIYRPFVFQTNYACPPFNYAGYKGCIRQDTLNRKIYIIFPSDSIEKLLYDFNMIVGDTIKGAFGQSCPTPQIITSIDSFLIGSDYRKKWVINNDSLFAYNVEGIGSAFGLLEGCSPPLSALNTLICFAQNGHRLYPDTAILYPDTTTACALISGINSINATNISITISPNPFHSTSTLKLNTDFENANLKIYNVLGEMVQQQKISSQSTIINRNELDNGIYFFSLINNKGNVASGKFVVE